MIKHCSIRYKIIIKIKKKRKNYLCTLRFDPLADHALLMLVHESVSDWGCGGGGRNGRRSGRRRRSVDPHLALSARQLVVSRHPRFVEARTVDPLLLAVVGRAGSVAAAARTTRCRNNNVLLLLLLLLLLLRWFVGNFVRSIASGAGAVLALDLRRCGGCMRQFVDARSSQRLAHGAAVVARIETG